MKKCVSCLCILFVLVVTSSVFAEVVEPSGVIGDTYYSSGTAPTSGGCTWEIALDRDGTDGGHITVELDGCEVISYEVFTMEQGTPLNSENEDLADLEPDDIFVVWDEDNGDESYDSWDFDGTYTDVTNDGTDYVEARTGPNDIIKWKIFRVDTGGTLTITGTGRNEHDAFHLQRNLLDFTKTDDVGDNDCVGPDDDITYEICWENTSSSTFEDAYIIDYLPEGLDYDWLISIMPYVTDPNYNEDDRTYTWELGDIAPNDSGCVSLTVTVNEKAEPGMELHNVARLWADPNMLVAVDFEDTPVCCWGDDPNIIYVDKTATGNDTGVSWASAYSGEDGLQKALKRVGESACDGPLTIYAAQGTYNPGDYTDSTFVIPEGCSIYGGFMAGGSDESQRDPDTYETTLTGHRFIDDDPNEVYHYHIYNDTIVTMVNHYDPDPNFPVEETTILDGFTISEATEYGIYGTDVDFNIANCVITDSDTHDGIYAADGDVKIQWSDLLNNGRHGIYHEGTGKTIIIENSRIIESKQHGVLCEVSTPTIKNSIVFGNGHDGSFEGINITLPTEEPVLYNNTIVYNALEGVYCYDDANITGDANYPDYPDMQNNILYYNNNDGGQVTISLPLIPVEYERDDYAVYCDIQGCDDTKNNNIDEAPGFMLTYDSSDSEAVANPYHYHLAYDSDCKDVGNPNHDTDDLGLYDIDGEDRIADTIVDIGADENNACDAGNSGDIFNDLDLNLDGIIDGYELGVLAESWLVHDPNEPGYTPVDRAVEDATWKVARKFNLSGGYDIDYGDFAVFADDWLWRTCWKVAPVEAAQSSQQSMMMIPMAMSFATLPEPASEPVPEQIERTTVETVSFVEGIYDIIAHVDTFIEEGHENAENLHEVSEFLKDVLLEMEAER